MVLLYSPSVFLLLSGEQFNCKNETVALCTKQIYLFFEAEHLWITLFYHIYSLWRVITVMYHHVFPNRRERPIATWLVARKPIIAVPLEVFLCHGHASYFLTLVRVGLEQHKRFVGWQDDLIRWEAIRAATVPEHCISVVRSIRQCAAVAVVVLEVFVVPFNVSFFQTYRE